MSYYNYFNERYFALPTSGLSKLNKANKSSFKRMMRADSLGGLGTGQERLLERSLRNERRLEFLKNKNPNLMSQPGSPITKPLTKARDSSFMEIFRRFKDTPIPSREGVLVKGDKRPALKFKGGGTPIKTDPIPKPQPLPKFPKRLSSSNTNIKKSYNNLTSQDMRLSNLIREYKSNNSRSLKPY